MKTITTKAAAAFLATAIGIAAVAPAMAQPAPPAPPAPGSEVTQHHWEFNKRPGPGHDQHGQRGLRGGAGSLLDFGRGAEAVEVALVRISHRIELTAEQQPLFDALKTDAMSAAKEFTTAIKDLRPTPPAEGGKPAMPSFSEQLAKRIEFQKAQLAALEAVQPSATAFFDSLTDEQKAKLAPQRGGPRGFGPGGFGPGEHGPRGFGPRR